MIAPDTLPMGAPAQNNSVINVDGAKPRPAIDLVASW